MTVLGLFLEKERCKHRNRDFLLFNLVFSLFYTVTPTTMRETGHLVLCNHGLFKRLYFLLFVISLLNVINLSKLNQCY